MKIACISVSDVPSSKANSIQMMKACQALAQLGHAVELILPGEKKLDWEKLRHFYGLEHPFKVTWLPANPRGRHYDFVLRAVSRARREAADLIYTWALQAAVVALLRRLPILLEMHGPPEGRWGPWLFRAFLSLAGRKRILPITRALVDLLEQEYAQRFSPGMAVVSPNGVDLARYQNLPDPVQARRSLNLPEQATAGYTGHLYPGRGISLLMELAHRFPEVQFLWVGGRPEDVAQWRSKLGAEGIYNVNLAGHIENERLPGFQAAAEILLMPYEKVIAGSSGGNSAAYCSPMKMFEYMACGRAILSSDLPVIREVLNETNARLCLPEDAAAWSDAFQTLLEDAPLRKQLGDKAREDVQGFTWEQRARNALAGFLE